MCRHSACLVGSCSRVDWSLLIVGLFAVLAFSALLDSLRHPDRWHFANFDRSRTFLVWTAVATAAAMGGAALAGASGSTLGSIAAVGVALEVVLLRLLLIAYFNRLGD